MKNLLFSLISFILFTNGVNAQSSGKILIRNASDTYPPFIASLNGVRIDNAYNSSVTFAYLDENVFRLKVFQYGMAKPLSFTINSEANYVSKYMIAKDEAGSFKIVLESKVLANGNEPITPITPTVTPVSPATIALLPAGPEKINDKDYSDMLAAIKKESFENSKLDLARNFFSSQHHSSDQVLGVIKLFSFENNKVIFAKSAYAKTIDKQNYYKVYDGFSFNKSKQELSDFIQKNP